MISKKQGQMQMSVGTIVTIVLLMTVLILGLVLVRTIFSGAIENIDSIDQSIKSEINKLFAEDDFRKIIIYPPTRVVTIKKGNEKPLGFAFSIRNIDVTEGDFTYEVFLNDPDIRENCNINIEEAESWIKAGRTGKLTIPPGSIMIDPEFVRFSIPENAPPCWVRYGIDVEKDRIQYNPTINVDLKVKAR
jgi:hypothetical protein|tara:strand:+ start:6489 stop:7058 length:570 start_codon:yes stop_codon:yes gene_type:complete